MELFSLESLASAALILLADFLPLLFFSLIFRTKNRWNQFALFMAALLFLSFGATFFGPGIASLNERFGVINPSTGAIAAEIPLKGRTYPEVLLEFERLKQEQDDESRESTLCRLTHRTWQLWINIYQWPDLLTHSRWKLPVCAKRESPVVK